MKRITHTYITATVQGYLITTTFNMTRYKETAENEQLYGCTTCVNCIAVVVQNFSNGLLGKLR